MRFRGTGAAERRAADYEGRRVGEQRSENGAERRLAATILREKKRKPAERDVADRCTIAESANVL